MGRSFVWSLGHLMVIIVLMQPDGKMKKRLLEVQSIIIMHNNMDVFNATKLYTWSTKTPKAKWPLPAKKKKNSLND